MRRSARQAMLSTASVCAGCAAKSARGRARGRRGEGVDLASLGGLVLCAVLRAQVVQRSLGDKGEHAHAEEDSQRARIGGGEEHAAEWHAAAAPEPEPQLAGEGVILVRTAGWAEARVLADAASSAARPDDRGRPVHGPPRPGRWVPGRRRADGGATGGGRGAVYVS